jgi:Tol biopolymer transport system component
VTGYAYTDELYSKSIIQSSDLIQIIDQRIDKLVAVQGDFSGLDGQISWGPQGNQVAFAYFDGNDTEIGVVDFTRSSFYQLTNNEVDDLMPAWQP